MTCQVKTQIDLGIHPVWSEFVSARRNLGSVVIHWVHSQDSDQTGRMPRLICVFAVRIILFALSCSAWITLIPCCPKSKSSFPTFPVPQNCLCAPVPLIFRPNFPCSPEINAFIPVFPKTPAWANHISMTSWVKQIKLRARAVRGVILLLNGRGVIWLRNGRGVIWLRNGRGG